jgi:C-terminal duplication domain of Friend of PRMT1
MARTKQSGRKGKSQDGKSKQSDNERKVVPKKGKGPTQAKVAEPTGRSKKQPPRNDKNKNNNNNNRPNTKGKGQGKGVVSPEKTGNGTTGKGGGRNNNNNNNSNKKVKRNSKGKDGPKKPLTAEELDRQLDDYRMKDDKTKEKVLEEQMDEYWERAKKDTTEHGDETTSGDDDAKPTAS